VEKAEMTTEERKGALTLGGFEEMFGKGDVSAVDELLASDSEDHQEAPGADFAGHLEERHLQNARSYSVTRTRGRRAPALSNKGKR